jgi:tetratricopeptide (TPR) repeat protein
VTEQSNPLQLAIAAYRLGHVERALALAGEQVALAAPGEFFAHVVLCEVLHRAGRIDELVEFLSLADEFLQDPRGQMMQAKAARRAGDLAQAESVLTALLAADIAPALHRVAAFELNAVLDRLSRHAEAWQAAAQAHQRSTRPFPVAQLVEALRVTAQAPAAELAALPKATRPAARTACVLGLPRSGTTLLEQMLDSHSRVRGIGEGPLPGQMADALARAGGGWPVGASRAQPAALDDMQRRYLQAARGSRKLPAAVWTLDKTLFPMLQPLFIAAVLPGAKVLRITRDARDNAVSLFMNNMDPSWGWTGSLDSIRQVIAAEREYLPVILDKLQLDVVALRFEDLVSQSEATLRRVLAHLGLDWEDACMRPHENARLVFTLSHEQVRQPVNRQGMGRWLHHREQFGADWDGLR